MPVVKEIEQRNYVGGILEYPIDIITRSYAPFETFGPLDFVYHGDDRGGMLLIGHL